jgi:hypothetical protein
MRKTITTIAAAATLAVAAMAPSTASADNGRITAGVIGGLAAGALIGAAASQPYYYGYGGPYAYYAAEPVYGPRCYIQRERFFDGFGWRVRRVRVCD